MASHDSLSLDSGDDADWQMHPNPLLGYNLEPILGAIAEAQRHLARATTAFRAVARNADPSMFPDVLRARH